jgi:hypothetical protein
MRSGLPRGEELLHDPRLNKSTAFSEAECEAGRSSCKRFFRPWKTAR